MLLAGQESVGWLPKPSPRRKMKVVPAAHQGCLTRCDSGLDSVLVPLADGAPLLMQDHMCWACWLSAAQRATSAPPQAVWAPPRKDLRDPLAMPLL